MNIREKFSAGLLCVGLTLAILPYSGNLSITLKPQKLLDEAIDEKSFFTADQVARFIVSEDSTVRIIDLRSPEEFRSFNIPGSISLPYREFLTNDPGSILNNKDLSYILYSNGDFESNYAIVLAKGMNIKNVFVMKGGLNEWFRTVMNSSFTGTRITARENALFETRTRARNMFTEINSLPDSLKRKFFEAKHLAVKKLDGGCE
jgi:rhodanese-related sulfurtransferase